MKLQKKQIVNRIKSFCAEDSLRLSLEELKILLPVGTKIYLIGGMIRDLIYEALFKEYRKPKDIDIIIDNVSSGVSLFELFKEEKITKTSFGGLRWFPRKSDFCFDIWLLSDTVLLNKFNIQPTIQNFLDSIDFTINSVVYNIESEQLWEKKCIEHINMKLIEFNNRDVIEPSYIIARALIFSYKLNFSLSNKVKSYIINQNQHTDNLIASVLNWAKIIDNTPPTRENIVQYFNVMKMNNN